MHNMITHLPGFRLKHIDVYNWGTFHQRTWRFNMHGQNALLTGDIGSGKSTLVDAITTLLVPAQRITYNKAAGADFKERSLRSYVLGYYKSERNTEDNQAKPVALRDGSNYSVILGLFYNEDYDQTITLAQVFWHQENQAQPARFFVVADQELNISTHFADFGQDMQRLKKQLRAVPQTEVFEHFPPYAAAFRRRFGLHHEQALELFHQTVSMKSVGNLTDFVRDHMLEAFDISPRIESLINHFDDLNRAHHAVLKAKKQIEQLTPLAAALDARTDIFAAKETLCACREALPYYFATHKNDLLLKRIAYLEEVDMKVRGEIHVIEETRTQNQALRDQLKQELSIHGGDRIDYLATEINKNLLLKKKRQQKAVEYQELCQKLDLNCPQTYEAFLIIQKAMQEKQNSFETREQNLQKALTEVSLAFQTRNQELQGIEHEIKSLQQRRSNIDARQIALRAELCKALALDEEEMPFVGELLQIDPKELAWEGAAERLLHNFGLSLLVPQAHYAKVSSWVEETHLKARFVYFCVPEHCESTDKNVQKNSLVHKIQIKPDSIFYNWLHQELVKRFDYRCCDDMADFRSSAFAITQKGQVKTGSHRHEKDDRTSIHDRSQYILGWSNQAKITALIKQQNQLQQAMLDFATSISKNQMALKALHQEKILLVQLGGFKDFEELNWQALTTLINQLTLEKEQLEQSSDILKTLHERLCQLEQSISTLENQLDDLKDAKSKNEERKTLALRLHTECQQDLNHTNNDEYQKLFEKIESYHNEFLGEEPLDIDTIEKQQQTLRLPLQKNIDTLENQIKTLEGQILKAMETYRRDFPIDTQELDAELLAADTFKGMLEQLLADDLPQFEQKFKMLLNENTLREIANFQSQLYKERQIIKERIDIINQSLAEIEYNEGRYIRLELQDNPDYELRSFCAHLTNCTEGGLDALEDEAYAEEKFLQVKAIIERFRGRLDHTEIDKRWTKKVTDVRNWFVFAASERCRNDDSEYEHYTDSGGKSGGQKEKLAYTVLAASLAYQFGLDPLQPKARNFRFVVIDEAFGRGSDESAKFGLRLFKKLGLQLLIVTPLQKIHIIEPYVAHVGFVYNQDGRESMLRCLSIEQYQHEREQYAGADSVH